MPAALTCRQLSEVQVLHAVRAHERLLRIEHNVRQRVEPQEEIGDVHTLGMQNENETHKTKNKTNVRERQRKYHDKRSLTIACLPMALWYVLRGD